MRKDRSRTHNPPQREFGQKQSLPSACGLPPACAILLPSLHCLFCVSVPTVTTAPPYCHYFCAGAVPFRFPIIELPYACICKPHCSNHITRLLAVVCRRYSAPLNCCRFPGRPTSHEVHVSPTSGVRQIRATFRRVSDMSYTGSGEETQPRSPFVQFSGSSLRSKAFMILVQLCRKGVGS